jgi:glycosyltransferase involved in cell wall biosynthesis
MITNTPTATWPHISNIDLICFSHLRWNFVYQRPQHLLSRFAQYTRVFFVEEPIFHDGANKLQINEPVKNVYVIVPHLQHGLEESVILQSQRDLINDMISVMEVNKYFCWYYTPMALPFSDHLAPTVTVYDCMDELSAFKFAPIALKENEQRLLKKADVVFTGGYSIYEAKQKAHTHIYPFPSSIDRDHFAKARSIDQDPADQAHIPHPRFGFYGVIDERFDIDMIEAAATARPDWQFVLIGPIVKIDPEMLPRNKNIHYLGGKDYKELPEYLAGWDVAIIPFAQNESTRFISPTKTPEYLAAGKPVISTPIRDVVSPYGDNKLVHIAATAADFIRHGDEILAQEDRAPWLTQVDAFLAGNSWDRTWSEMAQHIEARITARKAHTHTRESGSNVVSTQSI